MHKWGYEAVKYDAMPASLILHEKYHDKMYDPGLTTKEAYRNMIKKTREVLGEDCYMLACCGDNDADVLWVADLFDSSRIGGDIFKWDEFLEFGVKKVFRYYPLHNNVLYPDPDNVVMREEFNDIYQATSRMQFVSMLGLPVTFGDEFDTLDEARIDIIKKNLPVLDIHPMNIYNQSKLEKILKMVMAIEKEWESYSIINVFNTSSEKTTAEIDFNEDIGLDEGAYIVYDYTDDKLVKTTKNGFSAKLNKCQSKIFSIRKKLDVPQVISTSRHISQGACEIKNMVWSEKTKTLTIEADVIKDAPYTVVFYIPEGYNASELEKCADKNVYKKTIMPKATKTEKIEIKF